MNFNATMNQNVQFLNKINQNNHFLNQQQQHLANRFIGLNNLNSSQFNNSATNNSASSSNNSSNSSNNSSGNGNNSQTTSTSSPPLNSQLNNGLFNSNTVTLGLGQQQQQQQSQNDSNYIQLQRNYSMPSSNLMYPLNQLNINFNNFNSQNMQQQQQQINAPSLIASVLAANTACSLNNTLFVGNLHASLQEIDLVQVFRPFGRIVECCKKWLHFGFVKFTSEEEACHAYVTLNGFRLKGRPMRLEFQNRTKKARIKAILAQAALQASSNGLNCNGNEAASTNVDSSSLASLGLSSFLNEDTRQVMSSLHSNQLLDTNICNNMAMQFKSFESNLKISDSSSSSFFDSDQLIKFASSFDTMNHNEQQIQQQRSQQKFMNSLYNDFMPSFESTIKSEKQQINDFNFDFNEKSCSSFFSSSSQSSIKESNEGVNQLNEIDTIGVGSVNNNSNNSNKLGVTTLLRISPSESPHHEFSCSLSSSDSGCRSTASFLAEEDSGIASLQTTKSSVFASTISKQKQQKYESCLTEENLESFNEELNKKSKESSSLCIKMVNCDKMLVVEMPQATATAAPSNDEGNHTQPNLSGTNLDDDDCESSDSDTSDDASDIPDSECLDDLASLDDAIDYNSDEFTAQAVECLSSSGNSIEYGKDLNQVIETDGTIIRKKLEFGTYRSINQTLSLFIEPQDILKKIEIGEFNEYILFPNETDNVDSYFALVM